MLRGWWAKEFLPDQIGYGCICIYVTVGLPLLFSTYIYADVDDELKEYSNHIYQVYTHIYICMSVFIVPWMPLDGLIDQCFSAVFLLTLCFSNVFACFSNVFLWWPRTCSSLLLLFVLLCVPNLCFCVALSFCWWLGSRVCCHWLFASFFPDYTTCDVHSLSVANDDQWGCDMVWGC